MKSHHLVAVVTFLLGLFVGDRLPRSRAAEPVAAAPVPVAVTAPPPASVTGPSEAELDDAQASSARPPCHGFKPVSANRWEISRAEATRCLGNLNELAMQARIVPAFRDGVPQGFKLFSIRPGSLYEQLGLKNGDVIVSINGYRMNSPERALELYSALTNAQHLGVELEREGSLRTHDYDIVARSSEASSPQ